jgi:hypothetical protein
MYVLRMEASMEAIKWLARRGNDVRGFSFTDFYTQYFDLYLSIARL